MLDDDLDWRRTDAPDELSPILGGALHEFAVRGYEGTTVRDIARRAGTTVPALYYYHASKQAILQELLAHGMDRVRRMCRAAVAEAGDDPALRLLNLTECVVRFMAVSGLLARLDHERRALSPDFSEAHSAKRRELERTLEETIVDCTTSGLVDCADPQLTARALLGMYQAIPMWYRPGGPLGVAELARRYAVITVGAVGGGDRLRRLAAGEEVTQP